MNKNVLWVWNSIISTTDYDYKSILLRNTSIASALSVNAHCMDTCYSEDDNDKQIIQRFYLHMIIEYSSSYNLHLLPSTHMTRSALSELSLFRDKHQTHGDEQTWGGGAAAEDLVRLLLLQEELSRRGSWCSECAERWFLRSCVLLLY